MIGKAHSARKIMKNEFIIGIDPDANKSGVAIVQKKRLWLHNMTFFELFDYLTAHKGFIETVVVEAGFLNKPNWSVFKRNKGELSVKLKIANDIGRNQGTAQKIVEMLDYLKINYSIVKPTKTKLSNVDFQLVAAQRGYYGFDKRTNEEQRDAAGLII